MSLFTVSGVGGEEGCVLAFLWLWCFSWYLSLFHCVSGQLFGADDVAPASTLTTTSAVPSSPLSAGLLSTRSPIPSSAAVLPLSLRAGYIDSPSPAIPSSLSVRSRLGLSVSAAHSLPLSSSVVEPTVSVLSSATSLSSSLRPVPSPCVSMSADARFARMEATLVAVNQRLARERVSAPEVRRSRSPTGRREDRDDRRGDEQERRGRDRDEDSSRRRDNRRDVDRDEDPSRRRDNLGGRGGRRGQGRGSGEPRGY